MNLMERRQASWSKRSAANRRELPCLCATSSATHLLRGSTRCRALFELIPSPRFHSLSRTERVHL